LSNLGAAFFMAVPGLAGIHRPAIASAPSAAVCWRHVARIVVRDRWKYAVTTNPPRPNVTTTIGNSTCSANIGPSECWKRPHLEARRI
jgi:hypothetical protein